MKIEDIYHYANEREYPIHLMQQESKKTIVRKKRRDAKRRPF